MVVFLLSGCHLLPPESHVNNDTPTTTQCSNFDTHVPLFTQCNVSDWLSYWVSVSQLDWSARKERIEELSPPSSSSDRLKIILLSQVPNTPYQTRLRAQSYSQKILQEENNELTVFLELIVFDHAQRALELESAVTALSRINTENRHENKRLKRTIKTQARQLEKLMQIEKRIVEQPIENKP